MKAIKILATGLAVASLAFVGSTAYAKNNKMMDDENVPLTMNPNAKGYKQWWQGSQYPLAEDEKLPFNHHMKDKGMHQAHKATGKSVTSKNDNRGFEQYEGTEGTAGEPKYSHDVEGYGSFQHYSAKLKKMHHARNPEKASQQVKEHNAHNAWWWNVQHPYVHQPGFYHGHEHASK